MDDSACTPWTGRLNEYGYGTIGVKLAHRVAYERQIGPIPEGLELDHLCRNRACVNPAHLEPVTHQENVRRARLHYTRKPLCPRGHPNDYEHGGKWHCSTCRAERQHRRQMAKSHCKNGHPFDTVRSNGARQCSICARAAGKRAMDVRWHSA